jgi:hypothetical protein
MSQTIAAPPPSDNGDNTPQPYASTAEMAADMNDPRYTGFQGSQPDPAFVAHVEKRLSAAPSAAPKPRMVTPFTNPEEMLDALHDPRYITDPKFKADVQERMKDMDYGLGVRGSQSQEIMFDGKGGWIDVKAQRAAEYARQNAQTLAATQSVNVPGIGEVSPFTSNAEIVAAMSTPEYKRGDAVAHAVVEARLRVSTII